MSASLPRLPAISLPRRRFCPSVSRCSPRSCCGGRTLSSSAARPWPSARSAAMCRSIWTRAGSRGTRGPSRPSARCILRATRSRTGIFSARSWAAGSSGRRWGISMSRRAAAIFSSRGRSCRTCCRIFSPLAARSCMWSSSPSTRSASRSRRSRPSAIPSPRCGSTASSPPAFPSAAARPRTISPPENAS